MNYREAIDFLLALPDMERTSHGAKARTMSLESMSSLLNRIGDPHLKAKTVHITGSKGKGSTSAYLASILDSVAKVSLYTSPHLHSYRERICLNLKPVSEFDFAEGISSIKECIIAEHEGELGPVSTFGAMTALFFWLSERKEIEWQIVEVGMGGRFDATNVFPEKELVLITAISLEHTNVLGKSTLEIAENKAGIIRKGAKVILAPQNDPQVSTLIEKICAERGAEFCDVSSNYRIEAGEYSKNRQEFVVHSKQSKHGARKFKLSMLGRHQLNNAATAVAAVDALGDGICISQADLQSALERVVLPGRLEIVSETPCVILDGAHNGESAGALRDSLARHFHSDETIFVLGVNSDKNIEQIIESLKPACKSLIATRSKSDKAMDPAQIVAAAAKHGIQAEQFDSIEAALERSMDLAGQSGLVAVTGSLYVVAEAREFYKGEDPAWSLIRSGSLAESD